MELMLFTNDVELSSKAYESKIDRVVIDLENLGKSRRQRGSNLEVNKHKIEDIRRVKSAKPITVMCRLNPINKGSQEEIELSLAAGADILMLPMFSRVIEVEKFIEWTGKRARTSILFETRESVEKIETFRGLDVDEVYVGLNDLGLSFGYVFQYQLVAEGLVDIVRENFPTSDFGFGGITILDKGNPLPTRNIIKELARLKANQVIIRRAFKRDILGRDMTLEVRRLKKFYSKCLALPPEHLEADHLVFIKTVEKLLTRII